MLDDLAMWMSGESSRSNHLRDSLPVSGTPVKPNFSRNTLSRGSPRSRASSATCQIQTYSLWPQSSHPIQRFECAVLVAQAREDEHLFIRIAFRLCHLLGLVTPASTRIGVTEESPGLRIVRQGRIAREKLDGLLDFPLPQPCTAQTFKREWFVDWQVPAKIDRLIVFAGRDQLHALEPARLPRRRIGFLRHAQLLQRLVNAIEHRQKPVPVIKMRVRTTGIKVDGATEAFLRLVPLPFARVRAWQALRAPLPVTDPAQSPSPPRSSS